MANTGKLLALILALSALANARKLSDPVRTLRVCVLNDKFSPVSEPAIEEVIKQASEDYFREFKIELQISERMTYAESAEIADSGMFIFCPNSDITALFTDRVRIDKKRIARGGQTTVQDFYIFGHAWDERSVLAMYQVDARMSVKFSSAWVFKHELAHLFKVQHDGNPRGFMVEDIKDGKPAWTNQIRTEILKNRNIVFASR